jgi:hypothetical protein
MPINYSFGKDSLSDSNVFLNRMQQQVEEKLLAQEQVYNQLRQTGVEAPATILNMMDTGVRIGDNASMLHFNLEVHPEDNPAFRAETQNAVSDSSRPKFVPGATVYVKYNPADLTQVAVDHAALDTPRTKVVTCPYCGATQTLQDGQSACTYCGRPV